MPPKTTKLYKTVTEYFNKTIPVAESELIYNSPYELIVAVILSAQCTDKRVNMTTPVFFVRYPDVCSLATAEAGEVLGIIKSISYPNNKTTHLIAMAKKVVDDFYGKIPDNMEDLCTLPGVGRKTANVILAVAFGKPAMPVDTHVFRVSARIGLVKDAKTPLETEKQLVKFFPAEILSTAHHWLILHGRYTCKAQKPLCDKCGLTEVCHYFLSLPGYSVNINSGKNAR